MLSPSPIPAASPEGRCTARDYPSLLTTSTILLLSVVGQVVRRSLESRFRPPAPGGQVPRTKSPKDDPAAAARESKDQATQRATATAVIEVPEKVAGGGGARFQR